MVNWAFIRWVLGWVISVSLVTAGAVYILWFVQPLILFSGSASGEIWFFFSSVKVFGKPVELSIAYALRFYSVPIIVMAALDMFAGVWVAVSMRKRGGLIGWELWTAVLASQVSVVGSGYGMGLTSLFNAFTHYMTRQLSEVTSAGRVIFPSLVVTPSWIASPLIPITSYIFTILSLMSLLLIVWSLEREGLLS